MVTWGRNKARAPLVEPVAAVMTFMAPEERCWSRETVCGQTTAVTERTAAGLATEMRKEMHFYQGPRTVSCVKYFFFMLTTYRFATLLWLTVKACTKGTYLSFIMAMD